LVGEKLVCDALLAVGFRWVTRLRIEGECKIGLERGWILWGKGLDGDKGKRTNGVTVIEQSGGLVCGWASSVGSRGTGTTVLFDAMGEKSLGNLGFLFVDERLDG
jgi:hypothetical protein